MPSPELTIPKRPLTTTLTLLLLWIVFYASFTLVTPALLDDADSVHAEVAREMLLRHDYVTLYANGIRYLEKAPLLYWAMAACMRVVQMFGQTSATALAAAARMPLALTVLALGFAVEGFGRRAFSSPEQQKTGARAGLYAALILLSSPGIFLFTRILLPDAMVCLWLTLAMLCFWLTEALASNLEPRASNLACYGFAACCALNVLTKGLIGIVFPVAIVAIYLLLTRRLRGAVRRVGELHPVSSLAVFVAIAAPWHILIALANPTQGAPGGLSFTFHPGAGAGHWQVPLPTDGNVHGWAWFYFVNEQVLRYLNLRVPRDYDTVPLYLFWGLCFIWLMPWSAFVFKAVATAIPLRIPAWRQRLRDHNLTQLERASLLLLIWAAVPLLFFSLSTRQEYYVLPALPAICLLLAHGLWFSLIRIRDLGIEIRPGGRCYVTAETFSREQWKTRDPAVYGHDRGAAHVAALRSTLVLLAVGTVFAAGCIYFLLHTRAAVPGTDLAALLQQNPGDYAMSMGHFLDLNAQALGLFRLPLALAAASLLLGPLASYILSRRARAHAAVLALAVGAFGFLLAAHLGLQRFAPVLSSQQLAAAIAPQVHDGDLMVIHQEYEYGSTLGFYLERPSYTFEERDRPVAINPIHILTDASYNGTADYGRSSNLWYGSFFPDAPRIFETRESLAAKWRGTQRIFLWQDLAEQPSALPAALSPVYVIARAGGKEIVSNQRNLP